MPNITRELEQMLTILFGETKSAFIARIGEPNKSVFRLNPLRGDTDRLADLLKEQGFAFEPIHTGHHIFRMTEAPYPAGKTISHFLGHFYMQDLSSMIPPIVLNPQPGDVVADFSAAPGSKTTQLAALMNNDGILVANDADPKRVQALSYNVERMGIINTHVINTAAERLGKLYPETFDKILLDPPCSGIGTLHKNPEILGWWDTSYSEKLANIQTKLLISAIKALKPGGTMVYSTCTITPWENEKVIQNALERFPIEICPINNLEWLQTREGLTEYDNLRFDEQLKHTCRIYPHESESEGFFVALLRKTDSMDLPVVDKKPHYFNWTPSKQSPVKKYVDMMADQFGLDRKFLDRFKYSQSRTINFVNKEVADFPLYFKPHRFGLPFGKPMQDGLKLTTEAILFLAPHITQNRVNLDKNRLLQFVNHENLVDHSFGEKGQKAVFYKDIPFGYGYYDGEKLRSQMPRSQWSFNW